MNKRLLCILVVLLLVGLLAGCQCSHKWTEASCQAPRTCSKCSETEGESLPHEWKDATCSMAKTCSVCGTSEGEKLSHDYQLFNGYWRCIMCDSEEPSGKFLQPLSFPSETMTEEEIQSFIDLEAQNNLRNNARFQYQEGVLYGQYWDDAGQSVFIRMDYNDGTVMLLDYGWAKNICVVDGNIYYENIQPETNAHGIYRINMDNGEYVSQDKISEAYGSMQMKDQHIYYSDFSTQFVSAENDKDEPGLYRCDLDGKNVKKILDKTVQEFYVFDTGILYQDREDGDSLHICYPDGSGDQKINEQISFSPIYDGEYIYYLSPLNGRGKETKDYTVWRIKPDGTENQQVSRYPVINMFALYEDHIYFGNGNTKSKLFRMEKDGTDDEQVTNESHIYLVQFLNGRLKYTKYDSKLETIEGNYFCDPDGKNRWQFNPFE